MRKFLKLCAASLVLSTFIIGCSPKEKPGAEYIKGPALWVVKDVDTTVYLFGTVHVLKPETVWQTDAFAKAFAASDILYQEANVSEEVQQQLSALLPSMAFYSDGRTLMGVLDDEDEKEVLEAAEIVGLPPAALNRMKPWFAALGLTQMHMVKTGYRAESGVDPVLTKKAEAAGKPIRHFETAEQQLRMLADLPEDVQIEFLVAGSEAIEDAPDMLDELVADWEVGDVAGLADLISDEEAMGGEILMEKLLVERNKNWVKEIRELMDDEAGTFMVAVGAAHLAGEDSVIDLLREQGENVARQ